MNASGKVINKEGKTAGFIIDNIYVKYYDALKNIDLIDNLFLEKANVIASKHELPDTFYIRQINDKKYYDSCLASPLQRDVQDKLEHWKEKWSSYVLYVTGARQIGKTTELLKFAYKHYEQIIYVNLSDEKVVGINYDEKTKKHSCVIEKY